MLECTYTKDKLKKSKSWKDGYLKVQNNKIHLFDEDRKKIYTASFKFLSEEMVLPGYLIYCERIGVGVLNVDDELGSGTNLLNNGTNLSNNNTLLTNNNKTLLTNNNKILEKNIFGGDTEKMNNLKTKEYVNTHFLKPNGTEETSTKNVKKRSVIYNDRKSMKKEVYKNSDGIILLEEKEEKSEMKIEGRSVNDILRLIREV